MRSSPGLALFEATVSDAATQPRRSRVRAVGLSSALTIGVTPAAGLVLGATVWTANLTPEFVEDGTVIHPDDDSVKLTLLRLGPLLDWYPDPKRGFHSAVAATWMFQIERDTQGNPIEPIAMGPVLAVHTGYEWFVSGELSLGILGGFMFGRLTRTISGRSEHMPFAMPELALSATYH